MNPHHRRRQNVTASGDPNADEGLASVIRLHPHTADTPTDTPAEPAADPPVDTGSPALDSPSETPAETPADTAAEPTAAGGENFFDGDVALARALRTVPHMIAKTSSPVGFLTRTMPLPTIPSLAPATTGEPVAAVVVVDGCWRVHDTAVLTTAGWTTGTRVHFTADATGLLARTATADDPDAVCATIDGRGRLLIPGPLRRALGLRLGQNLLLMADPGADHVRIATLSTVHTALEAPR